MFQHLINRFAGSGIRTVLLTGVGLAGVAGLPMAAMARHPDFHLDVVVPAPPVCVQPVVQPQHRWVEPVYQTVTQQVWVPAVTQPQIQRVTVPAVFEWRDVVSRDVFGRQRIYRQRVMISPAYDEDRSVDVVICPGHYEQQTHQQLVTAGYWVDDTPVTVIRPAVRVAFPLPF